MTLKTCTVCPRSCNITPNQFGFCGVRQNVDDKIVLATIGRHAGLCVDPIEKKPFYHFLPGSKTLSLGGIGCNFSCSFCQNAATSQSHDLSILSHQSTPEEIIAAAKKHDCRSIALTYNEPIIWMEYGIAIAEAAHRESLSVLAVSNGFISETARPSFFDQIDAANIDLKSFSDSFYQKYCGGSLEPVLDTLCYLAKKRDFWFEVTTLLIPGLNDSEAELCELSQWIFKNLGAERPLHFSAFRPAFRATSLPRTPKETLFAAKNIAESAGLKYVYVGNIDEQAVTMCPQCHQTIFTRQGFSLEETFLDEESCCRYCGQTIAGVFESSF
ncbi:MAG: AmmeMemoRadiSam system radical SAM enzyme [Thermoguttaceae bacterium]